jgi:acyl-CoA synthetase (AMP-forming)/AMP-acid ligase II
MEWLDFMQWLIERFKEAPDKTAFIHEGRHVSYGQVVEKVNYFEKNFLELGVQQGHTVVLVGDYSPEVFCAILALALCGGIVIPLTTNSVIEESTVLEISGCDWYVKFDLNGEAFISDNRGVKSGNQLLEEFIQKKSPGLVLFSSGSTGKPKGILHDFVGIAEKFRAKRPPVIAIPFLMIDHFGGINTILAITSGLGTVVTVSDRSVAKICEAISKYKVELLPATPSFLNLLIVSKMYENFDLSSLKRITYGTEVMPQSTLDRMHQTFPQVKLLQTYGLSEVGVLHSQSRGDGSTWVRVGGDGFQTKVIDGILWIKSSYAMIGYLNAPSDFDEDGWFNTHDQVEVDGDYFKILGRETDLINIGGQKVYPAEIESIILELDNIEDVAIFGEKHALLGQIVVAKVLLQSTESLESIKKRIRAACIAKLNSFKVPSKVILVDSQLHNARQKKIRR